LSPANRSGLSPANRSGLSPANRSGLSPANRSGLSPANRSGLSPANRRVYGANHRTAEAPIASGDGRVTIFNMQDIFADTGPSSLQALPVVPDLPEWFTPIGRGYRYETSEAISGTVAFNYLQQEVPSGFEHVLSIYYRSLEDDAQWTRLETVQDPFHNLAAALMPHTDRGQGYYVLIATVEMAPLREGWNMFSYPVPGSQPVDDALISLADNYEAVYAYEPENGSDWRILDGVADMLEYGNVYMILSSDVITPYLKVFNVADSLTEYAGNSGSGREEVGVILGRVEGRLPDGEPSVTAMVGSTICAQAQIDSDELGERLFRMTIAPDSLRPGCGVMGSRVDLYINQSEGPLASVEWQGVDVYELLIAIPDPGP
jgi:hypothetical protein